MVIFQDLEFHNTNELEPWENGFGRFIQRYPKEVRAEMGYKDYHRGKRVSQEASGCEIRFVTESRLVELRAAAIDGDTELVVYNGDFFNSRHLLPSGIVTTIKLEDPARFQDVESDFLSSGTFHPKVWRFVFGRGGQIAFCDVDTQDLPRRPPKHNEKPAKRLLCYGSSITHGSAATSQQNAYVQQLGKRLGIDVFNLGVSGSCFAEPALVDWIASRDDWDLGFFEIGVNMRLNFNLEEYEKRFRHLYDSLNQLHPQKIKLYTGIYPNYIDNLKNPSDVSKKELRFNEIIKEVVESKPEANNHYINGAAVLSVSAGLSADLLHPSDFGHTIMAQNLAEKFKSFF